MANTYTQIHYQFVFATKFRDACIYSTWKDELHKFITGIVQRYEHKMLQINSMPDHIHLLIGMRPNQSVAELIKSVKSESTKWINEKRFCPGKFAWQDGYGAFTYSKNHVSVVAEYVARQEEHHKKILFRDEYRQMLLDAEIEFDEKYIFGDPV
jgi:putative transposase